ncbi:MAG TPA: cytochrome C oxidase Cbb3 [Slackia equolifaciens]|uniref:Cytochrome C oxidase Cbb3 n=1 Tax=Slackia equolifaciens TaxID=498718 RepID=A0A9D3A2D7_9ACTN|nr:cytochrome C oxidase Cbb3 [Slackia equolifaciens]
MDAKIDLAQTSDGRFRVAASDNAVEFDYLGVEVHNVRLDFDGGQSAQNVPVKIWFTDDAHSTYFDDTEYTSGVPVTYVATNNDESEYLNLNASGEMGMLRIQIGDDETVYPVYLNSIQINAPEPFSFNMMRFGLAAFVLVLCYAFRPKSSLYRTYIKEHPHRSKIAVIGAAVVEIWLAASFTLMGSNLVGVATATYNSGSWDGVSIVNTFEAGGDNAQQYAELAKSMANGKLYLEEEPPNWLQNMEDPYDRGARDQAVKETGENYLWDVAYYEGHYYVYFGVVPVLVFYLPFYLLTGANFPTAIGVIIGMAAFVAGVSALLDRFARYHFKRVSVGVYLLLQVALVTCCGVLYLLKFPTFYSLPIMLALAFSVWGLYFWMVGRSSKRPEGWYFAGSLCMALVVGCRPQIVMLSFLAFPLFWRLFITEGHIKTAAGVRQFACLIAPYAIVLAFIMWYNYARFGSPLDFGANYNLTVNDMTKRGMAVGRIAPALFAYFFQTPSTSGVFPYLQAVPFDTTYLGQTVKEATFGGIFACFPILWILVFARRILKMRTAQRKTRTVAGVIGVLIASGVIIGIADAEVAGILQRYFADFSIMFLMAAVLLAFILNENLKPGSTPQRLFVGVLPLVVAVGVVYSCLLCLVDEAGWWSQAYPWAYQALLEVFQFWT